MNPRPTERQLEVLRIVADAERAGNGTPTRRELCERLQINSVNGVTDHLEAIARKGLLRRTGAMKARAWTVTAAGWAALSGIDTLSVDLRAGLVAYEEAGRRAAPPFELAELLERLAAKAADGAARCRARYSNRSAR
jgi:SOS-response transcriptional repressor LexA